VHPGEEEEGGEHCAAEMRQEFSSSFTTTTHSFAVCLSVLFSVCVCSLKRSFPRRVPRAREEEQ
jgi:hypothetical protein